MDTQQLVIDSLPLAANIAGNISKRLPPHVDPRDLGQEACLGLLDAVTRYDPAKGVPFKVFARRRISGAVLDGLRREDHLSRTARARVKAEGAEPLEQPIHLADADQLVAHILSPHEHAVDAECQQLVAEAIDTLPVRLRSVLRAYYYDGKFMREIGDDMGICDSRASHMHCEALELLRQHFELRGLTTLAEVRP